MIRSQVIEGGSATQRLNIAESVKNYSTGAGGKRAGVTPIARYVDRGDRSRAKGASGDCHRTQERQRGETCCAGQGTAWFVDCEIVESLWCQSAVQVGSGSAIKGQSSC